MKIKHLVLALVFFSTLSCQGRASVNQSSDSAQPTQSAIAQITSPSAESTIIKSGTFVAGEHPTQGTARVVNQNGQLSLELDQAFQTSEMGPDLVVILHKSANVLGSTKPPAYPLQEGDYVVLAPLQKFSGTQSYPIPSSVNLEDYQSAVIWCRKFNATFGAAPFSS